MKGPAVPQQYLKKNNNIKLFKYYYQHIIIIISSPKEKKRKKKKNRHLYTFLFTDLIGNLQRDLLPIKCSSISHHRSLAME
jgi:hypothetical protein